MRFFIVAVVALLALPSVARAAGAVPGAAPVAVSDDYSAQKKKPAKTAAKKKAKAPKVEYMRAVPVR